MIWDLKNEQMLSKEENRKCRDSMWNTFDILKINKEINMAEMKRVAKEIRQEM